MALGVDIAGTRDNHWYTCTSDNEHRLYYAVALSGSRGRERETYKACCDVTYSALLPPPSPTLMLRRLLEPVAPVFWFSMSESVRVFCDDLDWVGWVPVPMADALSSEPDTNNPHSTAFRSSCASGIVTVREKTIGRFGSVRMYGRVRMSCS